MKPAPKIAITRFGAGVHSFWKAERSAGRHRPVGDQVVARSGAERVFCVAVSRDNLLGHLSSAGPSATG